jgi:hypothetical protein
MDNPKPTATGDRQVHHGKAIMNQGESYRVKEKKLN